MSYLAAITELLAKIVVGQKSKWGHLLHILGGGLWTYVALRYGMYALLIITVPAFFVNAYNFRKWHREAK